MPMSVDLPTPEPAMIPTRWPLPKVRRIDGTHAHVQGFGNAGAGKGLGGSA